MSPGKRPSQLRPMPDQSSKPIATMTTPTTTSTLPISFIHSTIQHALRPGKELAVPGRYDQSSHAGPEGGDGIVSFGAEHKQGSGKSIGFRGGGESYRGKHCPLGRFTR